MMGAEEKELFNAMAKELAAIKRWLPIFIFMGTLIGFSITGTRWFDNNIATKPELDKIIVQNEALKKQLDAILTGFDVYKRADTIDKQQIRKDYKSDIQVVSITVSTLQKKVDRLAKVSFVSEHKDKQGRVHPYNVQQ
jgi:hypothetical protein